MKAHTPSVVHRRDKRHDVIAREAAPNPPLEWSG